MEKYERHGLTRAQDDVLGSFGDDDEHDVILSRSITPERHEVVKELIKRELLESHMCEDFSIEFRLTPKGKKLWNIRMAEESEGKATRTAKLTPITRATKLTSRERFEFGQTLRRFVRDNPEVEDATGYSQGYYTRLIDNFIRHGIPEDADAQNNLFALIREAF